METGSKQCRHDGFAALPGPHPPRMLGRAITLTHKGARWTKCHKEHVQRLPNRMIGAVLSGMYLAWETPPRVTGLGTRPTLAERYPSWMGLGGTELAGIRSKGA